MANVDKEVIRKYNLQLNEKEYFAVLTLVGAVSYDDYVNLVNRRYSIRLGKEEDENFEIFSMEELGEFYRSLDESK